MGTKERPKGFLTPDDIAYLRGETDPSESTERAKRKRIRDRARGAIADFAILFEYLPVEDRQQVFLKRGDDPIFFPGHGGDEKAPPELEWDLIQPDSAGPPIFTGGLRHMHAFVYLCFIDIFEELAPPNGYDYSAGQIIEDLVKQGFQDAYGKRDIIVEADVSIDATHVDANLDRIEERFRGGDAMRDEEVQWLIQCRRISLDEMGEWFRDKTRHKDTDDEEERPDRGIQ